MDPSVFTFKLVKMVKNGRFHPLVSFCDRDVWTPRHFCSLLWWGRLLGTLKHSFSNLVLSPRCLWCCAICTIFKRFAVLTFSISTTVPLWYWRDHFRTSFSQFSFTWSALNHSSNIKWLVSSLGFGFNRHDLKK